MLQARSGRVRFLIGQEAVPESVPSMKGGSEARGGPFMAGTRMPKLVPWSTPLT